LEGINAVRGVFTGGSRWGLRWLFDGSWRRLGRIFVSSVWSSVGSWIIGVEVLEAMVFC
jgi:hypothetical protein